jgi:Tfp pilus assembly protein PilF
MARRGGQAVGMPPKVMAKKTMRRDIAIIVFLVLATVGAYLPAARCQFVYFDDRGYVFENRDVLAGLAWPGPAWAFTTTWGSNWHPVTWLSHMLDCQLFGPSAGAHHLVSVALHAASAVLLFWLLRRMTASVWPSAMVAALFALHPLHVESVAWVSERKDVLSTFFGLLALLAYVRYAAWPCVVRYLPVFALMAVGLMAKPMLVTLPFVMLLLDWWPLRRFGYSAGGAFLVGAPPCGCPVVLVGHDGRPRGAAPTARCSSGTAGRLVLEKLPLFILVAVFCVVTYVVQKQCGAMTFGARFDFTDRLANAAVAYVIYLGKTLWPANLGVFYPFVAGRPLWQPLAAAALLAAITGLTVWQARRRPYLAVGWFWFVGTLVPVIGLVQVGRQAMADRYTYVPLIGLFIALAWGAADLAAGRRGRAVLLAVVAAVTLAVCTAMTARQVAYWSDSVTLFRRTLAVAGDFSFGYLKIGDALLARQKYEEALAEYDRALRCDPLDPDTHNQRGTVLYLLERFEPALEEFREAVRLNPAAPATFYANMLAAYVGAGRIEEALECGREGLRLYPDNAELNHNMAALLHKLGRKDEAIRYLQEERRLRDEQGLPEGTP